MSRKVGKMWQFTIFTLLVMGAFALMGGGYLPWLITSVSMAIVADIIASRKEKPSVGKLALASGFLHMGQAWGQLYHRYSSWKAIGPLGLVVVKRLPKWMK